ncbi:unnamed protein product [Brassica rapa]|uniref:Uncharacterized protein n=1 Tax=Brassica campestris TaxID=3711 RepID=A0A8D9CLM6_BRACM|nr:unnamed protein product [Brassica rapa]
MDIYRCFDEIRQQNKDICNQKLESENMDDMTTKKHILVTGASLLNDHYRFLAINILLLWSITQRRRLFTTPIEPINCIISESVGWEMAIYVMPEEFSRIRVLDSKLSDQENLMDLSSYDVVLPQPPYRFHRTVCFSLL